MTKEICGDCQFFIPNGEVDPNLGTKGRCGETHNGIYGGTYSNWTPTEAIRNHGDRGTLRWIEEGNSCYRPKDSFIPQKGLGVGLCRLTPPKMT
jgi:hypothetical protein